MNKINPISDGRKHGMSRYSDWDGDEEEFPGQWELWRANAQRALRGKRGRKVLTDMREALLALPQPRLIEGAMCTVGAEKRAAWFPESFARRDFTESVATQGEGVCGVGAYLWYQRVKGGMDPAEAFDSLPTLAAASLSAMRAKYPPASGTEPPAERAQQAPPASAPPGAGAGVAPGGQEGAQERSGLREGSR